MECGGLICEYVTCQVQEGEEREEQFEEGYMYDQLMAVAQVARVDVCASLQLLVGLISDRRARLTQNTLNDPVQLAMAQEHL